MLEPGDAEFDELLELASGAIGPGLLPRQRHRWRELVLDLLGKLGDASTDRRLGLRAHARLSVHILAPLDRAGLHSSTVSAGGISLKLRNPPPKGTRLRLSIDTGLRPAPIETTAEVIWSRPGPDSACGALFVDLMSPDRELLEGIAISELLAAALV